MFPHATQIPATSGIGQVIHNYFRYLPQFGVELVDPDSTTYDIRVSHAGNITDADVATIHGLYWTADYAASPPEYATNARVIMSLRVAKEVTVPSTWVQKNIARDMRFLPHVVPHGIDWDSWQHDKPDAGYVIGYNKNRKGVDICDPSFADELAERTPDVQFVNTFANNALDNITLTGVIPHLEMKSLIQSCSVYVSTIKETGGIGILEAMASGKPILGFAEGAILDMVEHGVHGYLAQPGNIDDLVEGLHYCLKHTSALGVNARERAIDFSWEQVAKQVAGIYRLATIIQPPTCSVIIPTYNYVDLVGDAIRSAMQQNYPLLKNIVVVDDGSTDNGETEQLVAELTLEDRRVQYIQQTNAGVAMARNTGIASVSTKFVSCLDADDRIQPTFLSTLIPALEADPTLGVAYSGILLTRPDSNRTPRGKWPSRKYNYDQQVAGHNQVPTCCVFRREMWKRLGGYKARYCPRGAGSEDAEFWLRCGSIGFGGKKVTDDPLFIYSFGMGVTANSTYHEPDWLMWHPWTKDGRKHLFASLATPANGKPSHAVRQYDQPAISVIIPVGPGHEHMLIDALDSVEAQTYHNWEVIVINDTGVPLDLTAYPYVHLLDTSGQRGPGYARNRGIEVSRAALFSCLDADDFYQPTALEELVIAHEADPDRWIYTDMYQWKVGGIMEEYQTEDWSVRTLWQSGIAPVTCLYLKSQWEAVGEFDEVAGREDRDFHLRLAMAGYCGIHLPRLLFTYRHSTGTRRNEDNKQRESQRLKELYSEEKLQMACRGCGKKRSALPIPENATLKEESDVTKGQWPLIEYIGNVPTDMVLKGRTKRKYTWGANDYHRFGRVHPDDVRGFLRFPYFREIDHVPVERTQLVASPVPVRAKVVVQPTPPKPTPPPVEPAEANFDFLKPRVPPPPPAPAKQIHVEVPVEIPVETPVEPPQAEVNVVVDMNSLTVAKILARDWTPDEIRSIHDQELASIKPRVTIVRWAEKELRKLENNW